MKLYRLNPLAVKKFLERNLHRSTNDPISAAGIAEYLRLGLRPKEVPYEDSLPGAVTLYRCLRNRIAEKAEVENELQSLLPRVHPDLVQFCRYGIRDWVLALLHQYPTARHLAGARAKTVAQIPYITLSRAKQLIHDAQKSIASQCDDQTAKAMMLLTKQIIDLDATIRKTQDELCQSVKDDREIVIMDTITGIGLWAAVCLRLEFGHLDRFYSPEALVAYSGLDPRVRISGDGEHHIGISRCGKSEIRGLLYMVALVALRHNPVIRQFYLRLRSLGKPKKVCIVACMRKMLHLIYACCITDRPFDPEYAEKQHLQQPEKTAQRPKAQQKIYSLSLTAPVSWREARKRKAATLPQTGQSPRPSRGHGAAVNNCTISEKLLAKNS